MVENLVAGPDALKEDLSRLGKEAVSLCNGRNLPTRNFREISMVWIIEKG